MPCTKAVAPSIPARTGAITVTVSMNAEGEAVSGTVEVQVLDNKGAEYERVTGQVQDVVSNKVLNHITNAINAIRVQATLEILASDE